MPRLQRRTRRRVGRVSYYWHHGSWQIYYRDQGRPVRQRIGRDEHEAARAAAEVNCAARE